MQRRHLANENDHENILWSYLSASEVTTLRRYTNLFIIIIIIIIKP